MNWVDIENGESGYSVRQKLNSAFAELVQKSNKALHFMGVVSSASFLPTENTQRGDTYFCVAEDMFYFWEDGKWNTFGGENKISVTPTVTVGGATKGVAINSKTPSEILRQILCPYVAPQITAKTITPSIMLYGKTYNAVISVTAKRGSEAISKITIDGTENTITGSSDSVTRTKSMQIVPTNTTVNKLNYNVFVGDSQNNVVSGSVSADLVGGVFMFFSTYPSLQSGMELDFDTHNCQLERKTPDGTYTLVHSGKEYFYIVVPTTMRVNVVRSSNVDVPMTELSSSISMKQGEGNNKVSINMRVYRNADTAMDAGTFKFVINPKDN